MTLPLAGIFKVRFTKQRYVHEYELRIDETGRLLEILDLDRDDVIPNDLIREARSLGWLQEENGFWDMWFAATEQERLDPPFWQEATEHVQRFVDTQLVLTFDEENAQLRIGAPLQLHITVETSRGVKTKVLEAGSISKIEQFGI